MNSISGVSSRIKEAIYRIYSTFKFSTHCTFIKNRKSLWHSSYLPTGVHKVLQLKRGSAMRTLTPSLARYFPKQVNKFMERRHVL